MLKCSSRWCSQNGKFDDWLSEWIRTCHQSVGLVLVWHLDVCSPDCASLHMLSACTPSIVHVCPYSPSFHTCLITFSWQLANITRNHMNEQRYSRDQLHIDDLCGEFRAFLCGLSQFGRLDMHLLLIFVCLLWTMSDSCLGHEPWFWLIPLPNWCFDVDEAMIISDQTVQILATQYLYCTTVHMCQLCTKSLRLICKAHRIMHIWLEHCNSNHIVDAQCLLATQNRCTCTQSAWCQQHHYTRGDAMTNLQRPKHQNDHINAN